MARKNRESIYIYSEVKIHCLKDEIIYLKMSKKRQAENFNMSTTKSQRHEAWDWSPGLPGFANFLVEIPFHHLHYTNMKKGQIRKNSYFVAQSSMLMKRSVHSLPENLILKSFQDTMFHVSWPEKKDEPIENDNIKLHTLKTLIGVLNVLTEFWKS